MKVLTHGQTSLDKLSISQELLDQIGDYCRGDTHNERCGLLGGRGELALRFYPTANVAADPAHRFLVDPKAQLAAFRAMRRRREELLGIVHSHPNSAPRPSATDTELAAYPGSAYLIVSLVESEPEFACFRFEQGNFRSLPLEIAQL